MTKFFGIEIDTNHMTLEELEKVRRETRQLLAHIEHQIQLRKMANHKHSSKTSTH